MTISWDDFQKVELRVGTIISAENFPEARDPAYKIEVDLGSIGKKRSSAKLTKLYSKEELIGKQVICVTNFPPKQVANFKSEVLITGFVTEDGKVILTVPDKDAPNGARLA